MAERLKLGLGALVAVTCVAVLAVSAVWWQDRSEAQAAEQRAKQLRTEIKHEAFRQDCRITVRQWEGSQRAVVEKRYGKQSEKVIEICRRSLRDAG